MDKSKTQKFSQDEAPKKKRGFASKLFSKFFLKLAIFACLAAALYFGGKYAFKKFTQEQMESRRMMVERNLSECAELVLYKMRYSDIISIKKKKAMSSAYSIVRYSGIVRAGIEDVSKCNFIIDESGKNLTVKIPHTALLGNEILSQEIFDERQGVFAKITTQEVFNEIATAKAEAEREILEGGLLEDADSRAVLVIKQILLPIGFESVTVEVNP